MDAFHSRMAGSIIHRPQSWIEADAAARVALTLTGVAEADKPYYKYKICLQEDDNTLWMLIDTDTMEWVQVGIEGSSYTGTKTYIGNILVKQALTNVQALGSLSGNITVNWDLGQMATVTLTDVSVLTNPTNLRAGTSMILEITQGSGGTKTLTYGTNYKWADGTAPTLSTAAGAIDILTLISFDGTTIRGSLGIKDSK